jgi:hypothetical protein
MLENGLITFDLLWALWKPNTLAFTTTYGSHDEPRVFKVETAEKHHSIMQGDFYYIGGKYFEYDGKQFGYGSISEDLGDFRGARKITSLACYPLKYHKNEPQLRKDLIARGKKFVALSGVHYKSHQGMAYYKKKKTVVKVNINGRIMVDPQIHRRINPNYPVSTVRPKDHDMLLHDEGSADDSAGPGCGSESDADEAPGKLGEPVKYVAKLLKDDRGEVRLLRVPKLDQDEGQNKERLEQVAGKYGDVQEEENGDAGKKSPPEFGDEEYLIAAPVVLGFAFSEKLWLELTVSGVKEIQWNKDAYQSLVLEPKTKDIVKALVESHKYHAAESIDDVIQGKGKGLVGTSLHTSAIMLRMRRLRLANNYVQRCSMVPREPARLLRLKASVSRLSALSTWPRLVSSVPIPGSSRVSSRRYSTSATPGVLSSSWTRPTSSWRSATCMTSSGTLS